MPEIKYLRVLIIDDNFTANKKNAISFCEALINENLDMPWNCTNGIRLDTLDDDDDIHDISCWPKSNPSIGVIFNIEKLKRAIAAV